MNFIFRLCVVLFALNLAGCAGYHPLYGTTGSGENVASALASVSVIEQRSRAGQLVRNEVLGSSNTDVQVRYELRLEPKETTSTVSVLAGTNTKRKRYNLSVSFEMVDVATGTALLHGSSFSNVSYDTVLEPVADLQAADNARNRAATEVGQDLRLRMAAFLSSHKG
jgi:LPS-assembly lipoprotein